MSVISIIVPVYNVEKYLSRCLDSILAQTYTDLEILLLDDGSLDNSYRVISEYQKKDVRIKAFKCEHQGIASIRKKGIELATGEYIGFVDSDDWIEPYMYTRLYEKMKQYKCDLVSSDVYGHHENGYNEIIFDNYKRGLYTDLSTDFYPIMLHDFSRNTKGLRCYLVTKLFRAKLLKAVVNKIDTRVFYGEDAMILYRYCLACKSIYIMREIFYHYDIHSGSAETKPNVNEPENMYRLYCNLKEAFEESAYANVLMPQLYQYAILLNVRVLRGLYGIDLDRVNLWYFPEIEHLYGKEIVIYGAGVCGHALYKELWQRGWYEKIVAIVDKNFDKANAVSKKMAGYYLQDQHRDIQPISAIKEMKFDILVVAIYSKEAVEEAVEELREKWKVPKDKIMSLKAYKKDIASLLSKAYL